MKVKLNYNMHGLKYTNSMFMYLIFVAGDIFGGNNWGFLAPQIGDVRGVVMAT